MSIANLAAFPDYPRLLRGHLPTRRGATSAAAAAGVKTGLQTAPPQRGSSAQHAQAELPRFDAQQAE